MQNKTKKILRLTAVLLVLAFLVTALTFCGSESEEPKTSETTSGEASGSTGSGVSTASRGDEPTEVPVAEGVVYISPDSLSAGGENIYVADATGYAVYKMKGEKVEKTAHFGSVVSKVLYNDGKVYVLAGELGGRLYELDTDLTIIRSAVVGHTPSELYINGKKAYVCNRFSNTVSVVDLDKFETVSAIDVSREPVTMAASGNTLYVGCMLFDGSAQDEVLSCKIVKIDMASDKVKGSIALQDGALNLRGMAVSPDGKELYVSHTVGRYAFPASILDRGWINTNGFSIIDLASDKATAFLLDDVELGAGNPWDVEVSPDGLFLVFSISGTGELIKVDLSKLRSRVEIVEAGRDDYVPNTEKIIDHIEFLAGAKTRITLPGEGVRDIEIADGKIYCGEYFTGTVCTVDLKEMTVLSSVSLGDQPETTAERNGEMIFFGAKYCYQQWESCSSCHNDARTDSINWDEEADGIGTPKNTKSMVFGIRTPPVLATGLFESSEYTVRKSIRSAIRSDISDEDVEDVIAYLRSLLPVQSPYLNEDGSYTEAALRGKNLFEEVGCAKCHPAPLYSDMKQYTSPYLGVDGTWENRTFVTPTLVEVWRTSPYNFAGSEKDIKDVIKKFSNRTLTDAELSDLAEFVLSIGVVGETYGVEEVFFTNDGKEVISKLVPGAKLEKFTLRKQARSVEGEKAPVVTAKLLAPDGKTLEEKTFNVGKMDYNTYVSLSWDLTLPESMEKGTSLVISVSDGSNALATDYILKY